jgi:hyperosmotically inducible protein
MVQEMQMRLFIFLFTAMTLVLAGPATADKTTGQMVDDSVIQAEVKAKIMSDDMVAGGWDINLETRKGVVQLGGFIDDPEQAKLAAERAASVKGVVAVDNQLHQKSAERSAGQVVDDGITTTRVKSAIGSADLGKGVKINVDTHNGVVLLTGFVDTAEDKAEAEAVAAKDANTRKVINGIYVLD